jgi:histidine ammonia-lyase
MPKLVLDGQALAIGDVVAVARNHEAVAIGVNAMHVLQQSRRLVEHVTADERPVYGINTGFGSLSCVRIAAEQTRQLQLNLVRSHAAGVGEPLPDEQVRALMVVCAASLARGYSGVRPTVIQTMCALLNAHIHPVVPSRGSVGASGDLAPLAHVALALIGEGHVRQGGQLLPASTALAAANIPPLQLEAKEGLALLNGTHFMTGSGALLVDDAERLLTSAIGAAALSIEAARGSATPFDARIHALRPHQGQQWVAAQLRQLLHASEIADSHRDCSRVQDPYSLRCVPQVLGAVADALAFARATFETELGAVTDNPLCFADDAAVLSGGNFHGQPLALALDMLAIALTHLAAMADRRIYLLVAAQEPEMRLPPCLVADSGLRSGLMIAQYTSAALVNECQTLASPASIGNIPTSAGMEDFNSMGATAAHKCRRLLDLARSVVAIELLCAAQALEFQRPLRAGQGVEQVYAQVRAVVAPLHQDAVLAEAIARLDKQLADGVFVLEKAL